MNENKLTPEEVKAVRNLIIWFVVKIGSMFLIQHAIRRYLEKEYGTTDPNAIQTKILLKDGKLHNATYTPRHLKVQS